MVNFKKLSDVKSISFKNEEDNNKTNEITEYK